MPVRGHRLVSTQTIAIKLLPQFSDVLVAKLLFGLAKPAKLSPFGLAPADYAASGQHV